MLFAFFKKHGALTICLVGAVALSVESFLTQINKSLCQTEACGVVGKYLIISEALLVSGGAIFLWLLSLAFFFAKRYPQRLCYLPLFLLAPALAFDSGLIGVQVFTIERFCLLCFVVAALLLLIALIHCLAEKAYLPLVILLLAWAGGFASHGLITMPPPQGAHANMAFYSSPPGNVSTPTKLPAITLIMSMHCPHCLDVVGHLAEEPPIGYQVKLVSIDRDPESLQQLETFLQQAPTSANPYQLLKSIKEAGVAESSSVAVRKTLPLHTQNGFNFLANLGITSIPVLLVEASGTEKKLLIGAETIVDFLQKTAPPGA